jgi:uncharacterized membrane protein YesL
MNKHEVIRATITFAILLAAGIILAVSGQYLPQAYDQIVLVVMGGALVAGSLAFYLGYMFTLDRESRP